MIDYNIDGNISKIDLFPDDKFNILSIPNILKLRNIFEEIAGSNAKVVRIKGHGGSFAVGADIRQMRGFSGFDAKKFSILGNSLFTLMDKIPQVIIAEIDGFCMGGGVDFASSCDFRFATKKSRFAHPGPKLGIITGFGGTQRLPRVMKYAYYQELFTFGEIVDAEFMYQSNFVFELFENFNELHKYSDEFSSKIIDKELSHISNFKKLINQSR